MNPEELAAFKDHPELVGEYLKEQHPELYQQYLQETGQAAPLQAAPEPDNSYVPGLSEMGRVAKVPFKAVGHTLGLVGAGLSAAEDVGNSITGTEGAKILPDPKWFLNETDRLLGK